MTSSKEVVFEMEESDKLIKAISNQNDFFRMSLKGHR